MAQVKVTTANTGAGFTKDERATNVKVQFEGSKRWRRVYNKVIKLSGVKYYVIVDGREVKLQFNKYNDFSTAFYTVADEVEVVAATVEATEVKTVKCVFNAAHLIVGQEYKVLDETDYAYKVIDYSGDEVYSMKSNFEVVEAPAPYKPGHRGLFVQKNGFTFTMAGGNEVYTVVKCSPIPTNGEEYYKFKNSMWDGLEEAVEEICTPNGDER